MPWKFSAEVLLKDENGNVIESADDYKSVAVEIGQAELWKNQEETEEIIGEFYRMMLERKFVPNSRP
jgi:ribonucleotide reductase alpha subunit